ncbi:enoyl-CoA hydratase/isomerase family protein [Raineyella sp. LH-20]|uniref:enoyl-CoA hydratase/isomerase family protein n=1 Tax=Raineyella sp. LH-20 TaxID=3081204 RepID=UPI0029530838|nr:enoyl-CoA hydratase/isomerase family protein [Raineyella sp. LH-20]WOP19014.1 enoyl-CoA hydratase/isomerase family protein [Raineyella sp. LH-20]
MELTSCTTDDVLFGIDGPVARIVLNRPRAINALNLGMVTDIHDRLDAWAADDSIGAVVIQGAGARGLCSGGDVRAVRRNVLEDGNPGPFFAAEYAMNAAIADFPKPYVALMDGIVMGGGVGVSGHGSIRLTTENTQLAMPETIIGFTPDVGAQWLLARAPGRIGAWMAMTGATLDGADAVAAGFADAMVAADRLVEMAALDGRRDPWLYALAEGAPFTGVELSFPALSALHADGPSRVWIDECFATDDAVTVVERLLDHPAPAARRAGADLRLRCPLSVVTSLEALRRARAMSGVHEVLAQDLRVAERMAMLPDFAEGVRAQLVDKDQSPRWSDASIEDVDPQEVAELFAD